MFIAITTFKTDTSVDQISYAVILAVDETSTCSYCSIDVPQTINYVGKKETKEQYSTTSSFH